MLDAILHIKIIIGQTIDQGSMGIIGFIKDDKIIEQIR
jgi:hypothetical protein